MGYHRRWALNWFAYIYRFFLSISFNLFFAVDLVYAKAALRRAMPESAETEIPTYCGNGTFALVNIPSSC